MSFSKSIKEKALILSRRCCCICHEFAGLYTNVHHIKPKSKKGEDTLDNAIVLCLKCHGEVGHYNSKHPIGNSYSIPELKEHKRNWWAWCEKNPYALLPKSPITYSPEVIHLGSKEWTPFSQIDLYNKTDSFLYQVWLKILIKSEKLTQNDIEISIPVPTENNLIDLGNMNLDTQYFQVSATDKNQVKCLFLIIDKIVPKTSYSFNLKINSSIITDLEDSLIFHLASFSETPSQKSKEKGRGAIAFNFTPPEQLMANSVSILLHK